MSPDLSPRVFTSGHKSPELVSVFEALDQLRQQEACPDAERLAVFGRNHLTRHGTHSFLNALFRTLVGRDVDSEELQMWRRERSGADAVLPLISEVLESEEFTAKPTQHIPGVFQAGFAFDHDLLS